MGYLQSIKKGFKLKYNITYFIIIAFVALMIVLNNGGVLGSTLFHPEQPCKIRRYWIAL